MSQPNTEQKTSLVRLTDDEARIASELFTRAADRINTAIREVADEWGTSEKQGELTATIAAFVYSGLATMLAGNLLFSAAKNAGADPCRFLVDNFQSLADDIHRAIHACANADRSGNAPGPCDQVH